MVGTCSRITTVPYGREARRHTHSRGRNLEVLIMRQAKLPDVSGYEQTDKELLVWLKSQLSRIKESELGQHYQDLVMGRVAELIESIASFRTMLARIVDANKLAMNQLQFAQMAIHQLQRHFKDRAHQDGALIVS